LKLTCDESLSNFAFDFNSRRYIEGFQVLAHYAPGKAVQVDPTRPMLKAPGCERLKLKCDDLLSTVPFKINLRRYNLAYSTAVGLCRLNDKI
jgi:hypothetical protein